MTEQRTFYGTNESYLELLKWLKEVFRVFKDKRFFITVTNEIKRTLPQNSWFHKINTMITDFLRQQAKEQGNKEYYKINADTTKLWVKQEFLGYVEDAKGELQLRKTSNLKTFEMNQLWQDLQIYFAPLGLNLPDPNQKQFLEEK